jgi:hypothetical protein
MITEEVEYDQVKDGEIVKAQLQVALTLTPECLLKLSIGTNKRKRSGSYKDTNNYYMQKISQTPKSTVIHLHREEEDVLEGEHEFYQVVIHENPSKTRCDCKGFTFHQGIGCKHVVAVKKILEKK